MALMRIRAGGEAQADLELCAPSRGVSAEQDRTRIADEVLGLYDSLRLPLFRYLISLGLSPDHAEDVVQETFLRAYKHLSANGTRQDENIRAWVFRVAHNLAVNHRKISKRTASGLDTACAEQSHVLIDPAPAADKLLENKERFLQIRAAMGTLSKRERQCLHLRAEGLRYAEIAKIVGVSISTVAETLSRALAKIAA